MPITQLPVSPIIGIRTVELTLNQSPALQKFFDENPVYFLATSGEVAGPGEAHEEIESEVPAGWRFTKKWVVGYMSENGALVAMANIITDLLAPAVFHIGTFIVATNRHGTGDAQILYRGLEDWSIGNGAKWIRLGVVNGNVRAERFWARAGYVAVRERHGIRMGNRTTTVTTMFKPLGRGTLAEYLALVPRDQLDDAIAL